MPVYMATVHAYRSWSEEHPFGYVQRGEGLKPPSPNLARYREDHSNHPPARFEGAMQQALIEVVAAIVEERELRLHATTTTPTHVHVVISFRSPACTCGASDHCYANCGARAHVESFLARLKRKMGQCLAKMMNTRGRPWLSRGWDITPVRRPEHLEHLLSVYLPKHESEQAGLFRRYS
jgi:hypothetical protein